MQIESINSPYPVRLNTGGTNPDTKQLLQKFNDPNLIKLWESEGSPKIKLSSKYKRPSYGLISNKVKLGTIDQEFLNKIQSYINNTSKELEINPTEELKHNLEYAKEELEHYKTSIEKGYPFSKEEFLSELAHSKQLKNKNLLQRVGKYLKNGKEVLAHGENVYNVPGTVEYEAHSEIEPKLKEYYKTLGEEPKLAHLHKKGKKLTFPKDSRGIGNNQLITRFTQLTAR